MKKILVFILSVVLLLSLVSCGNSSEESENVGLGAANSDDDASGKDQLTSGELTGTMLLSVNLTVSYDPNTVSEDEKFGAALLNMSQEEFEGIGFVLGDSCDISFGNGYSLTDVPYFNGYYVKNGEPVIVAYPGNPYVSITLNNVGIWNEAGLKEGDSVTITLSQSGKYLAIQEALGQVYSFVRDDYPSDEAFSNFRALTGGNLKENFLFRGASPVDNSRNRAPYTDALLEKSGVKYVIDLADSEANMQKYLNAGDFSSDYVKGLYENGSMILLDMGSAYTGQVYMEKVVKGLRLAVNAEGPIYIHCMEGKDRTGFVCLLLEALGGATYDEMLADYMLTYKNYFKVTPEETPEKYDAIAELYFVPFVEFLHGTDDREVLVNADYSADAAVYLKNGGMTDEEIEALKNFITK